MLSRKTRTEQLCLLVLALLNGAVAIYLTITHYNSAVPLACADNGIVNCELVLNSAYAYVPGTTIPVAIAGVIWACVALILAGWFLMTQRRFIVIAQVVWGVIGMASVFYFIYVELVQVRAICAWCTVVHVLVLLYFLLALVQWQRGGEDVEEELTAVNSSSP